MERTVVTCARSLMAITQLIGFSPTEPLLFIEEKARMRIYKTVEAIDAEMRATVDSQRGGDVLHRELDIVCTRMSRPDDCKLIDLVGVIPIGDPARDVSR